MVSLSDMQGLWRRRLIVWPEGEPDTTTEVYWLQGPRLYADLRIPEGRPHCAASCLRELDWTVLKFLARQEGFFGHLNLDWPIANWHRAFDSQPDTGVPDGGHLAFEGEVMIEHGTEAPYIEHWVLEPAKEVMALSLTTKDRTGCLVAGRDMFMFAKSRSAKLPPGADLTECLKTAASLPEAQDLFDCEISFGRVRDHQWRIERSSLPFREGHTLQPDIESEPGKLLLDDVTPEGSSVRRSWQITSSESTSARPLLHWFRPTPAGDRASPGRDAAGRLPSKFGAVR
jgi:hypothetical protein